MSTKIPTLRTTHVLGQFRFGFPSGLRTNKELGRAMAQAYGVLDPSRVKGQVNVFRTAEVEEVHKHATRVRNLIKLRTLPFGLKVGTSGSNLGARLIANVDVEQFERDFNGWAAESEKLLERACASVEEIRTRDRIELDKLYDPDLYPTSDQLRAKYGFSLDWSAIPNSDDPRVGCSQEQVQRIKSSIEAQHQQRVTNAALVVGQRLQESLAHIVNRLDVYDGTRKGSFNDTLISNVRDLANLLPGFNLYNDPEVDDIRRCIVRDLSSVDPGDLRKDEGLREDVKSKAQSILDRVGSLKQD